MAVWKKAGHKLFPPKYNKPHVREDFPDTVDQERTVLLSVASAVLKMTLPEGQKHPFIKLVVNKLFLGKEMYTVKTLCNLPPNLRPSAIYTQTKGDKVAYFSSHSPLSNHYIAPFRVEGETFNCAEQFIMTTKARFCGDMESEARIRQESNPVQQKRIGSRLSNLDTKLWETVAKEKIMPGMIRKFVQVQVCRDTLMNTGQRQIFEANPHDKFWGVGVSLNVKEIWEVNKHSGQNQMGKILEEVRGKLREQPDSD